MLKQNPPSAQSGPAHLCLTLPQVPVSGGQTDACTLCHSGSVCLSPHSQVLSRNSSKPPSTLREPPPDGPPGLTPAQLSASPILRHLKAQRPTPASRLDSTVNLLWESCQGWKLSREAGEQGRGWFLGWCFEMDPNHEILFRTRFCTPGSRESGPCKRPNQDGKRRKGTPKNLGSGCVGWMV